MDSLQQTLRRKLSQIAPDGVLGKRELLAQVFCDYLPGPTEDVEDVLFAMTGEHKPLSHGVGGYHELARYCMFYRVWVTMPA
jgi:hypothetical protein